MQLVAYGAQDVYLTGNPQITFFKVVYRRHTNYSSESIEQTFNGSPGFGKKVTCTVSRNGDLIQQMYLRVKLPDVTMSSGSFRWLDWIGHILIKNVEIEIGGQRIDKHYGEWLHIWNELTQSTGHQLGYAHMVGNIPSLTGLKTAGTTTGDVLYIPLQFWFNRNPGLALPLIALQYHEVKVNIEFRAKEDCYFATAAATVPDFEASLFVDYIYLDTDERRRFAQVSHEYLIEQLQFTGDESTSNINTKVKLNFNHPCKELIWVVQPEKFTTNDTDITTYKGKQWFNFADKFFGNLHATPNATPAEMGGLASGGTALVTANAYLFESDNDIGRNPVATAKLQLNGHDRFSEREGKYFNLVQPYQCHENVPSTGINVYSFALKPEEHQPSGTCNMSRIDTATLNLTLTTESLTGGSAKIKVFAVNYNVLRIMSGMGGLAYSN